MYLIGHLYNSPGREKIEREKKRGFFRRKIECRLFSSIVSYLLLNMTSRCELCLEMKIETIEEQEQEYVLSCIQLGS